MEVVNEQNTEENIWDYVFQAFPILENGKPVSIIAFRINYS